MPAEYKIHKRWKSLAKIGIAVEYFPEYRNPQINRHGVDTVLLSLIISGRGIHYLREQEIQEYGSSIAVTHYGEDHSIVTAGDSAMEILNIYLDLKNFPLPELPESLAGYLPAFLPPFHSVNSNRRKLLRLQFADITKVATLGRAMEHELQSGNEGCLEAVQLYFRLFLIECCRQIKANGIMAFPDYDTECIRLEKVCRLLEEKYHQHHTLDKLAVFAGFQKNYLCRIFKQYTGCTIFEYLQEQRILHAASLLRRTNTGLDGIAFACGFNDISYFVRVFKKAMQCTPAQYRKI